MHFTHTQDNRQLVLNRGLDKFQNGPGLSQGLLVQKPDPIEGHIASTARHLFDLHQIHKVLPQLFFRQLGWRPTIVFRQLANRPHIAVLRPGRQALQLHIFYHFLSLRCHRYTSCNE